jgi:hypothetical protein
MYKNSCTTSPGLTKRLDRTRRAFALRKAGHDYEAIADIILEEWTDQGIANELPSGWNKRHAYKDVTGAMTEIRNQLGETALEIFEIEMSRLDDLLAAIWDKALAGKLDAIDRVLKIMDRRAKLAGLDRQSDSGDWRVEIMTLLQEGKVTMAQVRKELGDDLASQLIEFISVEGASNGKAQGAIEIRPTIRHSDNVSGLA